MLKTQVFLLRRPKVNRPIMLLQQRFVTSSKTPEDYLRETLEIPNEYIPGVIKAMESAFGKNMKVSQVQSFGESGIRAVAAAVEEEHKRMQEQQNSRKGAATSRSVLFQVPHHKTEIEVQWRYGESLLQVAQGEAIEVLGEYMEGTCGGKMSCCTCHVYLDDTTLQTADAPEDGELDMLDLAYEPKENSRLGCQVRLHDDLFKLDKVIVTIPAGVNDVWN